MVKIIICDEYSVLGYPMEDVIRTIFEQKKIVYKIEKFANEKDLLEYFQHHEAELAVLNTEMFPIDGVELGNILKEKSPAMDIIYISDEDDKFYEVLPVHPFAFMKKANFIKEADKIFGAWTEWYQKKILDVLKINEYKSIRIRDIMYIEGLGHSQKVYLNRGGNDITIASRMKELENNLKTRGFLRVHKSFLVNRTYVKYVKNGTIFLKNETGLPISRGKTVEIREQLGL